MRGGAVIEEMLLHEEDGYAQVLFRHLELLLERNDTRIGDVGRFAVASGPGSFTGVRVGLACAKGLAEALGKPLVAVSNLEAIASFGSAPLRAALLDARRGEIYGAVYDAKGRVVVAETVGRIGDWLGMLPAGEIEFLSTDIGPFEAALAGKHLTAAPRALAGAIGQIAAGRGGEDPAAVDASYVRRSDAELFWKE